MNQYQISVIIPVYNAKSYIASCLNSLLNQTMKNFEVIIVNDGSTDNTGEICDEYATKHENIQVIHSHNVGAGQARNKGLDYASGTYICFVDSDDWLEHHAFEIYLNKMQDNDLLIGCSHNCYFKNNELVRTNVDYFYEAKTFKTREEIRDMYVEIATNGVSHAPHNKLYKKSIIEQHQLKFPSTKKYEDLAFNNAYIDKINKLVIINDRTYNYRVSDLDAVATKLPADMFEIFKKVNDDLVDLLKSWNVLDDKKRNLLRAKFITDTASCINNLYNPNVIITSKNRYNEIKKIVHDTKVQADCHHANGSTFVNIIARFMRLKLIRPIMMCYTLKIAVRKIQGG